MDGEIQPHLLSFPWLNLKTTPPIRTRPLRILVKVNDKVVIIAK